MLLSPLQIPSSLITEISFGTELAVHIAARYGIEEEEFRELEQQDWFRREVATKTAELKNSGFTFRAKMASNATELLEQIYLMAKNSDNLGLKLDVAKYLTKIADLEPKTNAPVVPGGGFSITINLGESKQPVYQNATVRAYEQEIIEVAAESLPTPPIFLARVPFESLHESKR